MPDQKTTPQRPVRHLRRDRTLVLFGNRGRPRQNAPDDKDRGPSLQRDKFVGLPDQGRVWMAHDHMVADRRHTEPPSVSRFLIQP